MFQEVKKHVQQRFDELKKDTLFYVEVDRDKIWDIYLNAFEEGFRQENNCNCCKSFLRQYAGIVGIKNNKIITLWDFELENSEYKEPVKALRKYIVSLPIKGLFLNAFSKCGTDKNPDKVRNLVWNHYFIELPKTFVKSEASIGPEQSAALGNHNVLSRGLKEITEDAIDTVLELINQNSLYRGQEFKGIVEPFGKIKQKYKSIPAGLRDNFCWSESTKVGAAVTRIGNSAIGTLLYDLSEGKELDHAVSAFERVMAPANYKRTSAIITPRMIESAKKRLEELNLMGALKRRQLSTKDISVNNLLYVDRSSRKNDDIFETLKQDTKVNLKSLSKVEEVNIKDFIDKILPTSKSVKLLVENRHLGNFISLVGPQEENSERLFKWNNDYSWSYSGSVADSIKDRVKQAGGKVDGVLRISLSWDSTDDLDLHLKEPGGDHVYYRNRRGRSGSHLDIDANGQDGMREDPVENIYWMDYPKKEGQYQVDVCQFSKRGKDSGFTVELEYDNEIITYHSDTNGNTGRIFGAFTFLYSKKDGVEILSGKDHSKYPTKIKWNIPTGNFHLVKAILNSPNHWDGNGVGNKHYMFMLEGCKTDEPVRGIYNEFLRQDLNQDRKVFEVLGSKIEVESTDDELSGLGFSETIKNDFYVEVEGTFKRVLKVKI